MGVFQSKTYNVREEQDKKGFKESTIRRKTEPHKVQLPERMSSEIQAARITKIENSTAPTDVSSNTNQKSEDVLAINEESRAEKNPTEAQEDAKEQRSIEAQEHPDLKTAKDSKAEVAGTTHDDPPTYIESESVQKLSNAPEERKAKIDTDAILVMNEEFKTVPKSYHVHDHIEDQTEAERKRSKIIEDEIIQAVAHIPERRDSKIVKPSDEEIAKEKERLLAEIKEVETATKIKTTPDADGSEMGHKQERCDIGINTVKIEDQACVVQEKEQTVVQHSNEENKGKLEQQPEAIKQEAILGEATQIQEILSTDSKIETVNTQDNVKAIIETKDEIKIIPDIQEEETITNSDIAVIQQGENEDISVQIEAKIEEVVPVEKREEREVKHEADINLPSEIKVNKEQNSTKEENRTKLVPEVSCQNAQTELQENVNRTRMLHEESEHVSKDLEHENIQKKPERKLSKLEETAIIEDMCSRVNQTETEEHKRRRISLVMQEVQETKPQNKEEPVNHIIEEQEQKLPQGVAENLREMHNIEEEVKSLKVQIIHFSGTSQDTDYLTLHETLVRNIIKLDDISVENDDEIRTERKRIIKFAQQCLNDLEGKVEKPKASDDSDSD